MFLVRLWVLFLHGRPRRFAVVVVVLLVLVVMVVAVARVVLFVLVVVLVVVLHSRVSLREHNIGRLFLAVTRLDLIVTVVRCPSNLVTVAPRMVFF